MTVTTLHLDQNSLAEFLTLSASVEADSDNVESTAGLPVLNDEATDADQGEVVHSTYHVSNR